MKENKTYYIVQCYFPSDNETVNYTQINLNNIKTFGYVIAIFKVKTKQ